MITEADAQAKFDELGSVVDYMAWLRSKTFPRILEMSEFKALVLGYRKAHGLPVPEWAQETLDD